MNNVSQANGLFGKSSYSKPTQGSNSPAQPQPQRTLQSTEYDIIKHEYQFNVKVNGVLFKVVAPHQLIDEEDDDAYQQTKQ